MKLLYLSNHRLPTEKAHGLQIAKTCEALLARGADVLLVVPKRKPTTLVQTESLKSFYGLKTEIPTKKLVCIDLLLSHWCPRSLAYFLQSLSFLAHFLLRKKKLTDGRIVYTRSVLALLALNKTTPYFFEAHNFPKNRAGKIFQKWRLAQSQGVVCISEGLHKKYRLLLGMSHSIHVIQDAADWNPSKNLPEKNVLRKILNLPLDKPIALYTGSPYAWKGVHTLADATRNLSEFQTIFLGGNPNEPEFKALKKRAPHALVLAHVPHEKVPHYLATADFLILPNSAKDPNSAEDTSPLKLFEYLMSGKTIVASRVPALTQILRDNQTVFFEADNATDLKSVLKELLRKKPVARTPKDYSRFSWEARASSLLRLMREAKF